MTTPVHPETTPTLSGIEPGVSTHGLDDQQVLALSWTIADYQRRAKAALVDHTPVIITWGGRKASACRRCCYGDGVRFLWPCPTRQALTGEPAPNPADPTSPEVTLKWIETMRAEATS